MLKDLVRAFRELRDPRVRSVLWLAIGSSIAVLTALILGADLLLEWATATGHAWLDRIVVNACRMTVRRKRVREIPMPTDFDRAGTLDDPDGLAERDALERAFDRLTVDHRAVLVLHHVEERSVAEIAGVLQIPVGTVKSRLHAARSQLERALEADR